MPDEVGRPKPSPGHNLRARTRWPKREKLTMTVSYRGGPEAWLEIHTRGCVLRVPGHRDIIDVMREVWNDHDLVPGE